jgi:glycosylphosphatidylinositol transamidase
MDVFHLVVNLIGVIPLLERFERSYGTIPTVGLFIGRESSLTPPMMKHRYLHPSPPALSTVPAVLYVGIERYILRLNTWVVGAR